MTDFADIYDLQPEDDVTPAEGAPNEEDEAPRAATIGEIFVKGGEYRKPDAPHAKKIEELFKKSAEIVSRSDGEPEAEAEESEPKNRPDYLEMTIQSCIKPIEMRFSQINSCYRKTPVAYRSYTYINSVIEGIIPPERYSYAADETERGVRLSKWTLGEAVEAINKLTEAGRHIDFVTARVSPKLVNEVDFYGYIKEILDGCGFTHADKLCLEFPRTVLYEDEEKVRMAVLSMKLLKVKTMLSGFGEKDCPMTPLFNIPFDYVLLAPWLLPFTVDRNKHVAVETLITFLREIGCGIIADGAKSDEQITVLSRTDCYGYIPSPAYLGEVEHGRLRMPLDEAILQQEEEEV